MSGSFESVRRNTCVHRLDLGLYSHPKEFCGNRVRIHVNSKATIPSARKKNSPQRRLNPRRCITQDREPNTLPTSYSDPGCGHLTTILGHQMPPAPPPPPLSLSLSSPHPYELLTAPQNTQSTSPTLFNKSFVYIGWASFIRNRESTLPEKKCPFVGVSAPLFVFA